MKVSSGGRGSHGYGILELVESLLVEGRGKAVGWGWWRRVGRCSPRNESDQDGLGEEIDGVALFSVKNREEWN
jgi:hypothetical protein